MYEPILAILKTKATDNHGNEYAVTIRKGNGHTPIISIDGTPGKWYMSTLMAHRTDILSIDYGQSWNCVNWKAIADEISNGHRFY